MLINKMTPKEQDQLMKVYETLLKVLPEEAHPIVAMFWMNLWAALQTKEVK